MRRFVYIGPKIHLKGHTAYGVQKSGKFKVQVDRFGHRFSHGWWQQNPAHWESIA